MEYQTEFSLKQRLELWKASLNIDLTIDDINKLQDTLIDQMFDLQKQGFSEEEAFLLAQKRLGNIELFKEEQNRIIDKKKVFKNTVLLYLNGALLFLILDKIISLLYCISVITTDLIDVTDKFYNLSPFMIAISITLLIAIGIYKKYVNNKISLNNLKNTPVIVIATLCICISYNLLNNTYLFVQHEYRSRLAIYLALYRFLIIVSISIFSFTVFFRSKNNKMQLAY